MKPLIAGPESSPAIVLLHGWGASKEIWLPLMHSKLAETHRLVALDLPGVGDASDEVTNGSPDALARLLISKIHELGIDKYSVLGHSQGANIAARIADIDRDNVENLILVAPALYSDRIGSAVHYLNPVYGEQLLSSMRLLAGLCGWLEQKLPEISAAKLGGSRLYLRRIAYVYDNNSVPQLTQHLRGLIDSPFDISILHPNLPVLVIHGARDMTIDINHSREAVAKRITNTNLLEYADALHCPMDTHLEQFVTDVTNAIAHQPPPS
jgi:pyruvate dehydrogenase E2 component (dihydrolipoamide acetyltransferase)